MNPLRWLRSKFGSATSRMVDAARESIRPTKLKALSTVDPVPAPPKALGHSGFLKWKTTLDKPEGTDREQ